MATAAASHLECPVCHEGFTEPKLLPCAHLVCRKCVLSWLEKGGDQSGCPLCRAPILPHSLRGQGDLASQVDALPTDLATAVVVESEKTLSGHHVCSCCEDAEASLFCLQCSIKLCSACAKAHAKIPSTQDHVTEKLSNLSAEQLATHHQVFCVNHRGKPAELYCTDHEEMICVLCVTSNHSQCSELKRIGDVATVKREELRSLMQRLVDREAAVTAKINQLGSEMSNAQAKFKAMRGEVKATYDDLQSSVEAERQELNADIQAREDTYLAERKSSKLDLENLQAALSSHKSTAERLVASAPDTSLLGMLGKLKARLEALESQTLPDDPKSTPGSLLLRSATVDMAKKAVAVVGVLKDSEEDDRCGDRCLWCGIPLEGPAFAAVVKVGDRVQRGRNWCHGSLDGSPPGLGTVTQVDADLKTGYVWVLWDCSSKLYGCCMGMKNFYVLKFAIENDKCLNDL